MTRLLPSVCLCLAAFATTACGSDGRDNCDPALLESDPENCGVCGNVCGDGEQCVQRACVVGECAVGQTESCYTGDPETMGVGVCAPGHRTCTSAATWGMCVGEVTPGQEVCGNGVDENCSGAADEDVDFDEDGYTTCQGDCNDSNDLINPGAFESNGNTVDDDCDGVADNALMACDMGILSNTSDAMDFARAMDLCQTTTMSSTRWGVIDAKLSLADGGNVIPNQLGRAVRDGWGTGTGVAPPRGGSLVVMSSGAAADMGDANPPFSPGVTVTHGQSSALPADWLAANGGALPNVPGCPSPSGLNANDPVMLTLTMRVPSNAKSFSMKINFFSHEYPEWSCSPYNDFFVALLDSSFAGTPANPTDKNLAFYTNPTTMQRTPVGVNLAYGNTGLFTECLNGGAGCSGVPFQHTSCLSTALIPGTGFDVVTNICDIGQMSGGGTGWLTTSGNVVGGEIMTLRMGVWDTSDTAFDSTVLIDDFQWSVEAAEPGTVIE
jgi:hypothetical protein